MIFPSLNLSSCFYSMIIVFLSGIICSFINVMAGGGSILSVGIMMLIGIDPSVANGTNRIGLLVGGGTSVLTYRKNNIQDFPKSIKLSLWTVPGAILGAVFAIKIDDIVFQRIIAIVMIFIVTTLILPKPKKTKLLIPSAWREILIYPVLFLIGLFGGFVQAGVGFLLMAALRYLLNMDLLQINMHKVFIVLFYTIPVIFIFGFSNNIDWLYALALALGNALGAWISVKISLKKGDWVIKVVLCAAMVLMAIKLLLTF